MKTSATAQIFRLRTIFRALVEPNVAVRPTIMPVQQKITDEIAKEIEETKIVVYSKSSCPSCNKVKRALEKSGFEFKAIELDKMSGNDMGDYQDSLKNLTGARTVPRVYLKGKFYGGGDDTSAKIGSGQFKIDYNA